ncbi:hypothetical protein M441DRAFT_374139 [Trichoderma asperellum CBS 433.97]|uniref:Uncharacterized protein n=1 Tax=Trichoderma asperellum (strain ATCC 204424 / CBS 433.97 / NBRC 101777) TaxID=1042311 RepID=A0A2T3ZFF4_TRIA4|nr:hypothetical protein M441DRAFT_374139 [Trichoderma asperellum CBS 433.97]PTB43519.1 hypothetical protein M441DRAFT_374139 [Trichoderma asperellum CBS 433.97]
MPRLLSPMTAGLTMPLAPIWLQCSLGTPRVIHLHWQHPSGCGHDLNNEGPPHRPCDSASCARSLAGRLLFHPRPVRMPEAINFDHPAWSLFCCTRTDIRIYGYGLQRRGQSKAQVISWFPCRTPQSG